MRRAALLGIPLALALSGAALWWAGSSSAPGEAPRAEPFAAAPAEAAAPSPEPPPAPERSAEPEPQSEAPDRATAAPEAAGPLEDLSEEERRRRRRRMEHARAAEERFTEAVRTARLAPEDVHPAVRDLFERMRLEPELRLDGPKGRIDGMRIASLEPGSALAAAGFEEGDRLTRLGGEALTDPATVAHLMVRMGPEVEVCAAQGGSERCREVALAEASAP